MHLFGWAPLQYFAVLGLQRYGYKKQALEVATRFITTVNKGYSEAHTLFEKYDIQNMSIHTENKIQYSYKTNVVGFGWTNGVYLLFMKLINQDVPAVNGVKLVDTMDSSMVSPSS